MPIKKTDARAVHYPSAFPFTTVLNVVLDNSNHGSHYLYFQRSCPRKQHQAHNLAIKWVGHHLNIQMLPPPPFNSAKFELHQFLLVVPSSKRVALGRLTASVKFLGMVGIVFLRLFYKYVSFWNINKFFFKQ